MSLLDDNGGFDAGDAFKFLREKEGRAFPREYVLSLLKKGDIFKLSIPEDFGDDKELWLIYKLLYAPETLTEEDLNVESNLSLQGCTSLQSIPEGLSVGGHLYLNGCTSLQSLSKGLSVGVDLWLKGCASLKELPQGLSVGWNLHFKPIDPIPQKFGFNKNEIKKYIEQELDGEMSGEIVFSF